MSINNGYQINLDSIQTQLLGSGRLIHYPFQVQGVDFICWFTEFNCEIPRIQLLARSLRLKDNLPAGKGTFTIDFDSVSNIEEKTLFEEPERGNGLSGYKGLVLLKNAIIELISIHNEVFNCKFYFAQPSSDRTADYYERLLIPSLEEIGYTYCTDEEGDGWYVFRQND
jgi:hypothetical protein